MTIYSIVLYLKQSENPVLIDKEKGMIFSNWTKKKITIFFIFMIIITFVIFTAAIVVFIQRNNGFMWYDGWWRNFNKF
jgi:short subunit fatty acids transporter